MKTNIRIEKEKWQPVSNFGTSNAKFYGYCFVNGKRFGCVYKFKNDDYINPGVYVCNQDFNPCVHSKDNRPLQIKGKTLGELRENISKCFV